MSIKQSTIDKAVSMGTAASSAALAILAAENVISSGLAAQIVTGIGAVVVAYHGGSSLAAANSTVKAITTAPTVVPPVTPPAASTDPTASPVTI